MCHLLYHFIDNTVNSGDHWLHDPVVSTKNGMTVVLAGTRGGPGGNGWYNGDYEAERGVVLSVFNTGNSVFSSTAQVKMLEARAGAPSSFVIPVEFLEPVRPDRPSQKALVLLINSKIVRLMYDWSIVPKNGDLVCCSYLLLFFPCESLVTSRSKLIRVFIRFLIVLCPEVKLCLPISLGST